MRLFLFFFNTHRTRGIHSFIRGWDVLWSKEGCTLGEKILNSTQGDKSGGDTLDWCTPIKRENDNVSSLCGKQIVWDTNGQNTLMIKKKKKTLLRVVFHAWLIEIQVSHLLYTSVNSISGNSYSFKLCLTKHLSLRRCSIKGQLLRGIYWYFHIVQHKAEQPWTNAW